MSSLFKGVFLFLLAAAATTTTTTSAFVPSASRNYFGVRTKMFEALSKDSFDMDELKQRIAAETSPFADLFEGLQQQQGSSATNVKTPKNLPETVHIVSFQQHGVQHGIHSVEYPKGSGNNVVLAFESKQACDKFASTLRAQHFFDPTPQEMSVDELDDFCDKVGVYMQVVPAGVELIPPSQNVEHLGQHANISRRLREQLSYVFDMSDGAEFEEEGLIWDSESAFE